MNEVEQAKLLAAAVSYTQKEIKRLREELFKNIDSLNEEIQFPALDQFRGPEGPQGPQGPPGPAGQSIVVEALGPQGEKGDQGDPGVSITEARIIDNDLVLFYDNGETEKVGPVVGPRGGQGIQGERGPIGEQGEIGPIGPIGPQGAMGPKGDKGDIGLTGPQGKMGPMGPEGPKGEKGEIGLTGPQGEKGDRGDVGPMGPRGEKGEQGLQGEVGPQGAPGRDGRDGTEVDVQVIKRRIEDDLQKYKDGISAQITRMNLAKGGGGSTGSGEVRFEFLDDVNRDSAKVDGKFLQYNAASGKWIGADAGGTFTVQEEGVDIGSTITTLNFVGSTVTASGNSTFVTINSNPDSFYISNTAARTLINDRLQVANAAIYAEVANVQSLAALANTNLAIADRLQVANATATFATIASVSDRMQVANAQAIGVSSATWYNANDTISFTRPDTSVFDVTITGFSDSGALAASNVSVTADASTITTTQDDVALNDEALVNPNGFLTFDLGGVSYKIPYFN
jgi:hypothetical protein